MYEDNCHIKDIHCKFDGMCQPLNPGGIACYGFIILKQNNQINNIYEEAGIAIEPFTLESSNNVAEYVALIKALEWLINNGYTKSIIFIQGDSQLIINQICGKYKVRSEKLMFYYKRVKSLMKNFSNIQLEWIGRDKNKEADDLANKAYIEYIDKNYEYLQDKLKPYFATDQQLNLLKNLKINPSKYLSAIEANRFLKKFNEKK